MQLLTGKACIVGLKAKIKARPFYQNRRALMEKTERFDGKPSKGVQRPSWGVQMLFRGFICLKGVQSERLILINEW